jgi:hypothetical protein
MFQNLEQEVSMITLPESCFELGDDMAHFLFDPLPENFEPLSSSMDMLMAIKVAKQVFEHDPPAMVDAIELHIMLAEIYLYKWEDIHDTMKVLLVAIVLSLGSVWEEESKIPRPARLIIVPEDRRKKSVRSNASEGDDYEVYNRSLSRVDIIKMFCLASYATRFVTLEKPFPISFEHSKSLLLRDVESDYYDINNPYDSTAVLVIQLEIMIALRYIQLGKPRRACNFVDRIISLYESSEHSSILITQYAVDLCPYTIALLAQSLIMGRDMKVGLEYWHKAFEYLQDVEHSYSSTIAMVVLLSCSKFVGEYEKLKSLLEKVKTQGQRGYDSLGAQFTSLVELWLDLDVIGDQNTDDAKNIKSLLDICQVFDNSLSQATNQSTGLFLTPSSSYVELTLMKISFLEIHGCALERIYVACIGRLWSCADKAKLYKLEQRLQSSLQILLQCPIYDYVSTLSAGINIFHCLVHILHTAQSTNGISAAAVYLAVTERAEQPLLRLIQSLQKKDIVALAGFVSHLTVQLPLHGCIIESYKLAVQECKEKVSDVYGNAEATEGLKIILHRLGQSEGLITL